MGHSNLRVALARDTTVFFARRFDHHTRAVTVGRDDANLLPLDTEALPDAFALFRRVGSEVVLRVPDSLGGEVLCGGEQADLAASRERAPVVGSVQTPRGAVQVREFTLRPGDGGIVELDRLRLIFTLYDDAPGTISPGLPSSLSPAMAACLVVSTACHMTFLLFAFLQYRDDPRLDEILVENRFARLMVQDTKDPLPEPEDTTLPASTDTLAKRAGGEEGKFGAADAEVEESRVPRRDGEMITQVDVKNLGVNKALSSTLLGQGPLQNIFGDREGFDAKMNAAMSGDGDALQIGRGVGGVGMRGLGRGGGGDGFGRIGGLGKVDTGSGRRAGARIRPGRRRRPPRPPKITFDPPKVGDFCDKNNLRRVVRAKRRAITYCFEKELQKKPRLKGKIVAQWQIGLDGKVMGSTIASSTMDDRAVEGCISRVVRRMRFKKPRGGICVINYPFVFSGL